MEQAQRAGEPQERPEQEPPVFFAAAAQQEGAAQHQHQHRGDIHRQPHQGPDAVQRPASQRTRALEEGQGHQQTRSHQQQTDQFRSLEPHPKPDPLEQPGQKAGFLLRAGGLRGAARFGLGRSRPLGRALGGGGPLGSRRFLRSAPAGGRFAAPRGTLLSSSSLLGAFGPGRTRFFHICLGHPPPPRAPAGGCLAGHEIKIIHEMPRPSNDPPASGAAAASSQLSAAGGGGRGE